MKSVVFKMDSIVDKDSIILEITEKKNVVNVLIGNFASQVANRVAAKTQDELMESTIGLEITSRQLGSFISELIVENGNLTLNKP